MAWLGFVLLAVAAMASSEPGARDAGRVAPNADAVEPLPAGTSVPSVSVRTIDGEPIDLSTLTRDTGALLVFYRGGW
jgi:hypothetical protein